ncbi:uncharacterized protein LOC143559974 [Bidens hawaiensis]|uniref:uncharacterized protein LOC143559974 n=1 Tax=Bidens hawaiensis TaxID=980011 RepID=UPI00404AF876
MSCEKRRRSELSSFSNQNHGQSSRQASYHSTLLLNAHVTASSYIDIGDCDNLPLRGIVRGIHNVVREPYPRRPYTTIIHLFQHADFMSNTRAYNSVFSMTSFGAKVDDTINRGSSPYAFKISGQIHHWLGTLCPPPNERPRFLQMYVYDTENEIANRLHPFFSESINALVKLFCTAKDLCSSSDVPNFCVRLYGSRDKVSYDMPSQACIGAIVTDPDLTCTQFDIIIRHKDGGPQRINKLHPLYMPLQYPLLFLYGEHRWSSDLYLRGDDNSRDKKLTMNIYYSYLLHDHCIQDAVQHGDTDGKDVGKRTVLPSSFVGGPRYMYKHYQDALAICRVHGKPQYFTTFTCNVKWPEIERKVFGDITADLYTAEFQKRGLPHCHILLWVAPTCVIKDACEVDKFLSVEIPDLQLTIIYSK